MDPELLNAAAVQVQQAIPFGLIAAGVGSFVQSYLNRKTSESIATDNERIALANLRQMDNAQKKSFEIAQESENFARQQWWDREQRLHPLRVAGMGAMWAGQKSPTPEVRLPSKPEPVDWGEWQSTDYGQLGAGAQEGEGYGSPCPEGQSRNPTTGVCEDRNGRTGEPRDWTGGGTGGGTGGTGNQGHWVRCPDGSFREAGTCPEDGDGNDGDGGDAGGTTDPCEAPADGCAFGMHWDAANCRCVADAGDDVWDSQQVEDATKDLDDELPGRRRRRGPHTPMSALIVNPRRSMMATL